MRKYILAMGIAAWLIQPQWASAAPFPEKTDEVVQDESGYLNQEEVQEFTELAQELPFQVKVVVVENIMPEASTVDEYAKKLYDNYNLSDNTLMVVLDIDTQELGEYPGQALQDKGASLEMLQDLEEKFYEPFRSFQKYMEGIKLLVTEADKQLSRPTSSVETSGNTGDVATEEANHEEASEGAFPWWVYAIGIFFLVVIASVITVSVKRRKIFLELDRLEDWKDNVTDKLNAIDLNKPLRRVTGLTEDRFIHLVDRKENLLKMMIPDVEMMILEAEEACERMRFRMARELIAEGNATMEVIEAEVQQLKEDTAKVMQTKQENKVAVPEIGKLLETAERKLTNARLDFGLSFHDLKSKLDDVGKVRVEIKAALAEGDDVKAFQLATEAQQDLQKIIADLEQIPGWVQRIQKEYGSELKQLEDNVAEMVRSGFHLGQTGADRMLLQVKQILLSAKNALEEGNLTLVETHAKAFSIALEETYDALEKAVESREQIAATLEVEAEQMEPLPEAMAEDALVTKEVASVISYTPTDIPDEDTDPHSVSDTMGSAIPPLTENEEKIEPTLQFHEEQTESEQIAEEAADTAEPEFTQETQPMSPMSEEEKNALWSSPVSKITGRKEEIQSVEPVAEMEEVEYELVIPKPQTESLIPPPPEKALETEDDVLDEMERISNALLTIRQFIQRSYLPGIPYNLKASFEQVVQALANMKRAMESYRYELDELIPLIHEANEALYETERLAQTVVHACRMAEGAIQYANRYRRQSRQVNDMLTKAEQAFRELSFEEALSLAEEARMLMEGEDDGQSNTNRWMLRKKRKGVEV